MMHGHTPPARATARDAGFGLVEIIIVMFIIIVLGSLALGSFGGSKGAARAKEAFAAAATYETAVASWMSDHGNKKPTAVDMAGNAGPRNLVGRPYIRVPAGVQEGRLSVDLLGVGCTGAPPATATGTAHITYCAGAADTSEYGIRVQYRASPTTPWEDAKECWRGNVAATPRCG